MEKIKKFFRCIHNYFFCKKYPFWKITDSWYCYNTSIKDKRIGSNKFFTKYDYTWYDDIPYGWQKAFGKRLSEDIKKAGKKYLKDNKDKTWKDILSFQQIKEKWGELCLYASAIDSIRDILDKYELMSIGYCICCGKPARYITEGWVSFQCEKCFEKHECWKCDDKNNEVSLDPEEMKKYKDESRLNKKDIPQLKNYSYKILKTENFKTEKSCNNKWNKLWDDPSKPSDMVYSRIENNDGTWSIEHKQQITHIVDIKKEYDIDFEKLWGLDDK